MNLRYFVLLVFLSSTLGCFDIENEVPIMLSGKKLNSLVSDALHGDKKANDSLSGIININWPENKFFNSLQVDSFHLASIKYYSVLINYSNPVYNRFAIYDSAGNCYLIDKSLNGNFSFEIIRMNNFVMIKMIEKFSSIDSVRLIRLSFYRKIANSINLVYRNFSELKLERNVFNQTIYSITPDTIKTKLQVPINFGLRTNGDIFIFSDTLKAYRSNLSLFDSLVYGVMLHLNNASLY